MNSLPKLLLLLIFPVLLFLSSCTKEIRLDGTPAEVKIMPPYTDTGANTFACKINGKIWIAQGSFWANPAIIGRYNQEKTLTLIAYKPDYAECISYSSIENVNGLGEIILGAQNKVSYTIGSASPPKEYYETSDYYGGKLIIKKLDTVNRICSGIFYFDAVSAPYNQNDTTYKKGEVVHITEGQFDFKYPR